MNKNLYNNKEEEHQHVVKLLSELPKENAPDNFEYNLSVKIKNKNFALNTKEPSVFASWKVLAPVFGTIAASVLVFFTVFNDSDSLENPFQMQPQLRTEMAGSLQKSSELISNFGNESKINQNDVVLKEEVFESEVLADVKISNVNRRARINKKKADFPFNDANATNLDEELGKSAKSRSASGNVSLVGGANPRSSFQGFYIRDEVDKEYVEALKARNDSLRKVLSLRKNSK